MLSNVFQPFIYLIYIFIYIYILRSQITKGGGQKQVSATSGLVLKNLDIGGSFSRMQCQKHGKNVSQICNHKVINEIIFLSFFLPT
jgi:hypothetical protein